MLTVLVDYESGNLHSAQKAFERMAREVDGGEVLVTNRPEDVLRADRVVLPGDGAFPACKRELMAVTGMVEALAEAVLKDGKPFLGICVGMQLLATTGHEYEDTPGLGWIPGDVVRITPSEPSMKVPHMGWNDMVIDRPHPVLDGLQTGDHAYFVHSYRFEVAEQADLLAHVEYGGPVTAIIGRDNVLGTQFHPEKSQSAGLRLIGNFLRWKP
ncbi:imidazole glycerol phosphate synthase subunit HisH [Pararhodobacter marinus]|uniref:Imidazole glycerol phosphate synthase subunit HisH n=1 Tax=Pararhodobacter marinus TaxID=2184063 RepID=A0A2U2C9S0_9RHOB|nr:imidazole glycerol phosphate synthase subunit HisH [Pararhodobacter marinus]PWE28602.1 imidazole glycerol phosphate synthase subunit HisH [Pararhodobacter marinus]